MIRIFSVSEPGGHVANEDVFVAERHPTEADCWLCFLADGQGGRAGGADAAQLACRTSVELARKAHKHQLSNPVFWSTLLRQTDLAVSTDADAGYTTLVGFCIADGVLTGASSGDSAVLVVSGEIPPNEITASQLKNPPVGSGAAIFVPFAAPLVKPWTVVAMSDGVWKYVGWQRLTELIEAHRGQDLIEAVLSNARLPKSGQLQDDFTMAVISESA